MVSLRRLMAAVVLGVSGLAALPASAAAQGVPGNERSLMVRDGGSGHAQDGVWYRGRAEGDRFRRHERSFTRDGDRRDRWDRADRRERDERWDRREDRRGRDNADDRDDRYGRYDRPPHDVHDDRSARDGRDDRYGRDHRSDDGNRRGRSVDGRLNAEDRFDEGRGDGGYDGGYAGYAGDGTSSRRPRDSRGYDLRPDRERRVHRPRVDDRD